MPDREKVIKGLEHCSEGVVGCQKRCPYKSDFYCRSNLARDALSLLKEKEPLTVHDPGAICPNCKWPLYPEDHPKYCGNCGRAVKWD